MVCDLSKQRRRRAKRPVSRNTYFLTSPNDNLLLLQSNYFHSKLLKEEKWLLSGHVYIKRKGGDKNEKNNAIIVDMGMMFVVPTVFAMDKGAMGQCKQSMDQCKTQGTQSMTQGTQSNFCWPVRTLREKVGTETYNKQTPAMMAVLSNHVWTMQEWATFPVRT